MDLTVVYCTSRNEPRFDWFFESLRNQCSSDIPEIIVVDTLANARAGLMINNGSLPELARSFFKTRHVLPKPTIWQGEHRLTNCDWWAKSNALNTGIALCKTEWIAFMDDRSVLLPSWLLRVKEAMDGEYAVCGAYQKRANLEVVNGEIVNQGTLLGSDHRPDLPHPQLAKDWFGGHGALPLEWALAVNGFSEDICDSLGLEDAMFGLTLWYAGFPQRYDSRMKIVEDRTPGEIDGALKRADKGVSPNDKSHAIVAKFEGKRESMNSYNLRDLRESVLAGNPFPPPSASPNDWFDGQPVAEMI